MSRRLIAATLGLVCCSAFAQSADAPAVKSGDSWVYTNTTETGPQGWARKDIAIDVERVDSDDILLGLKESGSTKSPIEQMVGIDWSRSRDVNGEQKIVSRPFAFPLNHGKKWELQYAETNPNRKYSSETIDLKYVVTGWEDIQVPAGNFKALKVECEGQWTAVFAPGVNVVSAVSGAPGSIATVTAGQRVTAHTTSGKIYRAYWYVPSQKRFVKSIDETYSSDGMRTERVTEELASSKMAG
jgi:hypothetical protein